MNKVDALDSIYFFDDIVFNTVGGDLVSEAKSPSKGAQEEAALDGLENLPRVIIFFYLQNLFSELQGEILVVF